ncbi:hypothetical protein CPB84DRAFT_1751349 [Gymnopilus junonius]|uniref:Uncharacterized protein n=1 Tax=Gymnopilus junonius TaxID=109634 RepID=A0A9P5NBQ8_GYMJU|nr:hypothetical protein CPB84DRAFT_1751349 [Gymnopilus junonius]
MEFVEDNKTGLKTLWHCKMIWTRLFAYVNLGYLMEHKGDDAVKKPLYHLSECPNAPRDPPPSYENGYRQMHAVEAYQSNLTQPPVCNIEGIQDAVNHQIFDVINAALQMRYFNKADTLSLNDFYVDSDNRPVPVENIKPRIFYPAWLRSCRQHHITKKIGTAGFTDMVLFASPGRLNTEDPKATRVALHEGKPSWVYVTEHYQDILQGDDDIVDRTGKFKTQVKTHYGNLLLKQLWGQCASLGPNAGFTTNGNVVMLYFRVVPRENMNGQTQGATKDTKPSSIPDSGFVLSPLMQWSDPRLRACLFALSCMTLDEKDWSTRQSKDDYGAQVADPVSLRDLLCPEAECTQIVRPEA